MKLSDMNPSADMASCRESRFRLIGLGGAGCRMVECLASSGLEGASFAALNTDLVSLDACISTRVAKLQLGVRLTRGLGAGGDPEVGRSAAEDSVDAVRALCRGAELVFILSGLGGGTGTGAAPVVARLAREAGALVIALVTLPFECEGARRQRQAERGLSELKAAADVVLCLPNERVLSLIDTSTSLMDTFRFTEELVAQGVRGIWRLAGRPGLINVDLADLRAALRDRHAESFFACSEARGDQRAREVVERLLLSPLLENGTLLREAGNVLVSLVAGTDLSMAELNHVMERLKRECEGADLLVGAAVDPTLDERLCLTLIATRRGAGSVQEPLEGLPESASHAASPETNDTMPDVESFESDFFRREPAARRPRSRFVAPAPALTPEQRQQALMKGKRLRSRPQQTLLPLEIVSKGRFEKSEPTLHRGEDLDVPTFVRRGLVLN